VCFGVVWPQGLVVRTALLNAVGADAVHSRKRLFV
jgi:hypothetical protein